MLNQYAKTEIHHRSRKRIKILGEVFTPEAYVYDMLGLLDNKVWCDENVSFFEPCCGHGNIVLPIFIKRIESFYKKYYKIKNKAACLYAVANAMNTLWAIDIDSSNVVDCQKRILQKCFEFLEDKLGQNSKTILKEHLSFMAHLICAISWQIHENEALSALSNKQEAAANAEKTKIGGRWFRKNGHVPLNLRLSWCEYFECCEKENSIPIIYEKAIKILSEALKGLHKKTNDFEFVHDYLKDQINLHADKKPLRGRQ